MSGIFLVIKVCVCVCVCVCVDAFIIELRIITWDTVYYCIVWFNMNKDLIFDPFTGVLESSGHNPKHHYTVGGEDCGCYGR